MKIPNMALAISHIDPNMIADAATVSAVKKRPIWRAVGAIAACLAVAIAAGAYLLPRLLSDSVIIDGIERNYRPGFTASETGLVYPWEYLTLYEQYSSLTLDGTEYRTRGREVSAEWIEHELGIGEGRGYDMYDETEHIAEFPIYKIKYVSETRLVAALMDGHYYVYAADDAGVPATLGELLDDYALSQTLPLTTYTVYSQDHKNEGRYATENGAAVWQALADYRDAEAIMDDETRHFRENSYISFTATSEPLGVYKRVFYVVEEGYIWTNICDYAAAYEIGSEAAAAIIAAVRKDEVKLEDDDPYHTKLCGTVTEIGEDYFLLDDSAMCVDPDDGMVFKIMLDDIRIRRCFAFPNGGLQVGSTIAVTFEGKLTLGENNTLTGAIGASRGYINKDGNMLIPE